MHSHHTHSGTYVSHAKDALDDIVAKASSMGFQQFCLTEHMARFDASFLYPEELEKSYSCEDLQQIFKTYIAHARDIQRQYNSKNGMKILVGFEVEGVDQRHIQEGAKYKAQFDMAVGSVHHVFGIPIDFDQKAWRKARDVAGSTRNLYRAYFDLQYEVLTVLKPEVVGHIDLIRLFQPEDDTDSETGKAIVDLDLEKDWPDVWSLILRNIKFANSYGALFELNSAALRKGWDTPYPKKDIAMAICKYGGARFCLSDDSHGLAQVGLNYHRVWEYVTKVLKLQHIYRLDIENGETAVKKEAVELLTKSPFWDQYR